MGGACRYWCPKGCGKQVFGTGAQTTEYRYKCFKCGKLWTKVELATLQKMHGIEQKTL